MTLDADTAPDVDAAVAVAAQIPVNPGGAVEVRLHRARARFRKAFQQWEDSPRSWGSEGKGEP